MAYTPRTHDDYQIGVICALAIEKATMVAMLDESHDKLKKENSDDNEYTLGRIGVHNVVIACLPAGLMGNGPAAIVAKDMQRSFPIKFGLMVGVGGGVWSKKDDIRLGDVVVSQPTGTHGGVVQWDFGKTERDGKFRRTGSLDKPPPVLLHALQELKIFDDTDGVKLEESLALMIRNKPRMALKYQHQGMENDVLFKADYDHEGEETCDGCDAESIVQRLAREDAAPRIHYGNIASGNEVMKHGTTRDRIAKEEGVICFEMEAAGLMDNFRCLVIRGICDYADSHKNKIWQPYAAATAAAFARALLGFVDEQEVIKMSPSQILSAPFPSSESQVLQVASDSDRLCLLSLDSGGVRGLSMLYILRDVMKHVNEFRATKGYEKIRPCEAFDLIVGTGTGGLIAVMLGRLGMEVENCIEAYSDIIGNVFRAKPNKQPTGQDGKLKLRLDHNKLSQAIESTIQRQGLDETKPFYDQASKNSCRVLVCAAGITSGSIIKFKSYEKNHLEPTILQAALATSANPRIFSAVNINKSVLLFERHGENNPIHELVEEAKSIWNNQSDDDLMAKLGCIVSIGAGSLNTALAQRDKRFGFLTEKLKGMEKDTSSTETEFSKRIRGWTKTKYYRFNIEKEFENVGLLEHEKKDIIEEETTAYLGHENNMALIKDCSKIIGEGVNICEIYSLIKTGQIAWDTIDKSKSVLNSLPHFLQARKMLRHYRKRSPLYSSPLIKVNLCMVHNYRLAGIGNSGSPKGEYYLRRAREYLDEAESEAKMNIESKHQMAVSVSRLYLDEAEPRINPKTPAIDSAAAALLLQKAKRLQQDLNSLPRDQESKADRERLALLIEILKGYRPNEED